MGTPYEEWLEQQPKIEVEETPDDKDVLIADLTLQLMETQNTVVNLQNDMANLTLQILRVIIMRNIGIRYYKMGLYNEEQFALFVKRGFVTEEEFKELTGQEYQDVIKE